MKCALKKISATLLLVASFSNKVSASLPERVSQALDEVLAELKKPVTSHEHIVARTLEDEAHSPSYSITANLTEATHQKLDDFEAWVCAQLNSAQEEGFQALQALREASLSETSDTNEQTVSLLKRLQNALSIAGARLKRESNYSYKRYSEGQSDSSFLTLVLDSPRDLKDNEEEIQNALSDLRMYLAECSLSNIDTAFHPSIQRVSTLLGSVWSMCEDYIKSLRQGADASTSGGSVAAAAPSRKETPKECATRERRIKEEEQRRARESRQQVVAPHAARCDAFLAEATALFTQGVRGHAAWSDNEAIMRVQPRLQEMNSRVEGLLSIYLRAFGFMNLSEVYQQPNTRENVLSWAEQMQRTATSDVLRALDLVQLRRGLQSFEHHSVSYDLLQAFSLAVQSALVNPNEEARELFLGEVLWNGICEQERKCGMGAKGRIFWIKYKTLAFLQSSI